MSNSNKDDYRKNNLKIKKRIQIKNTSTTKQLENFYNECKFIKDLITNSIISIDNRITLNIFSDTDAEIVYTCLSGLHEKITKLCNKKFFSNEILNELQSIVDDLTTILCGFGTYNIESLLLICTGKDIYELINVNNNILSDKVEIIMKHIEPTGYKIIKWKDNFQLNNNDDICIDKNGDNSINIEQSNNLECFIYDNGKNFYSKVYGIRFVIQNTTNKITMIINGTIKNLSASLFKDNKYVSKQLNELKNMKYDDNEIDNIFSKHY